MKKIHLVLLSSLWLTGCSPTEKSLQKTLEEVNTVEEANALREKHPDWMVEILDASTDGRAPNEMLQKLIDGEVVTVGDSSGAYSHKLLTLDSARDYSFRYIFFSGEELTQSQIDVRREEILKRYRSGQEFATLANQFTMDGNTTGGALGWMEEEKMQPEFATAMRKHKKGDVFAVDIPDKGMHYLVLKTDSERNKLKMRILKVRQGRG